MSVICSVMPGSMQLENAVRGNSGERTLKWQHDTKWNPTVMQSRQDSAYTNSLDAAAEVEFTKLQIFYSYLNREESTVRH